MFRGVQLWVAAFSALAISMPGCVHSSVFEENPNPYVGMVNCYKDVPKDHWAKPSIQRCLEGQAFGIDYGSKFRGDRIMNRYMVAILLAGVLDKSNKDRLAAEEAHQKQRASLAKISGNMAKIVQKLRSFNKRIENLEASMAEIKKVD